MVLAKSYVSMQQPHPQVSVIFDIDGTLVDSTEFDNGAYVDAIRHVLGPISIRPNWGDYEHVTDAGILRGICLDNQIDHGICVSQVRTRFGELISAGLRLGPCPAVRGGVQLLQGLLANPEIEVGIATGGWGHTARMKLDRAGYDFLKCPLASSDDGYERDRIMQHCRARMSPSTETVYIGDGEWDKRATEKLGWRFIGIGPRLRGSCTHWFADFSVPSELRELLIERQ
jgi:phosphoglycolate phosphatase-like HAD superfamily hydrolase